MDDFDELKASEFVTDTDDQDSLDERIDTEQALRNQQLWASFQNAACCITRLYKDRNQPNVSLWVPFQNAASNLTTLYKDCIESQRRFAKIGYQVGKGKRKRASKSQPLTTSAGGGSVVGNVGYHQSSTHQSSVQATAQQMDNLVTFQQALVQPAIIRSVKSGQNINSSSNNNTNNTNTNGGSGLNTQSYLIKSEEDRLMELNRFLSEEYHRHVGSRKRSCSAIGGNMVKRVRE